MDQEEGGSLAAAVAAWLDAQGLAQLQELQPGACLALEVDVVDLAASQQHGEVVQALLEDPGALGRGAGSPVGLPLPGVGCLSGLGRLPAHQLQPCCRRRLLLPPAAAQPASPTAALNAHPHPARLQSTCARLRSPR